MIKQKNMEIFTWFAFLICIVGNTFGSNNFGSDEMPQTNQMSLHFAMKDHERAGLVAVV